MREQIEALKRNVEELEKTCDRYEAERYRKQPHKEFLIGAWVRSGNQIGIVAWTENPCLNISNEDGYFGLDIKNGRLGFAAPCKRDDYELLDENTKEYFTESHRITLDLTGEMIERLLYELHPRNVNPSPAKDTVLSALEKIRVKHGILF